MRLGKLDIHLFNNKTTYASLSINKIDSMNQRPTHLKLLEEITGKTLQAIDIGNEFLDKFPTCKGTKTNEIISN
jgi:hypothetical protein